ncbi:MAG: hypothetical protein ACRDNW_03720 [Trebonia sp.]
MVAVIAVSTLIQAAARVGVELIEVDNGGNLYVWHAPLPERAVVYIGKSASDKRVADERRWREGDPRNTVDIGLVTLLRVNRATPQALDYDPDTFDSSKWRTLRAARGWSGAAFDNLDEALAGHAGPDAAEVEKLLVRIAVRYGAPIGNSQFASQWEDPIGTIPDTLAVLAVDSDPSFVIPPHTEAALTPGQ